MKRALLLLSALSLVACMPRTGNVPTALPFAAGVLSVPNTTGDTLKAAVIVLTGPTKVTPSQGTCSAPSADHITDCHLGDVAKGQTPTLTVEGDLSLASGTARLPDGSLWTGIYAR